MGVSAEEPLVNLREIAEIDEAADRDAGARPVLDGLHAGFEVEADGALGRQCSQQRRLAGARRPENRDRRLVVGGRQTLVGGYDPDRHQRLLDMTWRQVETAGR